MEFIVSHLFLLQNIISLAFVIYILLNYKYRYSAHIWIFLLIVFPIGGILLFLIFGRDWKTVRGDYALKVSKYYKKFFNYIKDHGLEKTSEMSEGSNVDLKNPLYKKIAGFVKNNQFSDFTYGNNVETFFSGKENFKNLKKDLSNAQEQILMQFYIWRNDDLTSEIHKILIEKAKSGVEVKIVYDFAGNIFVNKSFIRKLKKNNIKIISNFKWEYIIKPYNFNHRDHRKIVVIDSKISYSGGMNMGKEYIDGGEKFKEWRDINLKITGNSVNFMKLLFATNWFYITGEKLNYTFEERKTEGNIGLINVSSGPQLPWQIIKQIFCTVISNSSKYLYIQSPYFIPDSTLIDLLTTASLTGIDVRLMITGKPDKYIPFWAAHSFMEPLIYSGVKVYTYEGGFMHSKMMVCENLAIFGSTNFDIRSFKLNYELSTVILDSQIADNSKQLFLDDINKCDELTLDKYKSLSVFQKLRNSLCSLLFPIL